VGEFFNGGDHHADYGGFLADAEKFSRVAVDMKFPIHMHIQSTAFAWISMDISISIDA